MHVLINHVTRQRFPGRTKATCYYNYILTSSCSQRCLMCHCAMSPFSHLEFEEIIIAGVDIAGKGDDEAKDDANHQSHTCLTGPVDVIPLKELAQD